MMIHDLDMPLSVKGMSCGGKYCYPDEISARSALKKARARKKSKKGHIEKRVYRCPDCGYWHLTSMTRKDGSGGYKKKVLRRREMASRQEDLAEEEYRRYLDENYSGFNRKYSDVGKETDGMSDRSNAIAGALADALERSGKSLADVAGDVPVLSTATPEKEQKKTGRKTGAVKEKKEAPAAKEDGAAPDEETPKAVAKAVAGAGEGKGEPGIPSSTEAGAVYVASTLVGKVKVSGGSDARLVLVPKGSVVKTVTPSVAEGLELLGLIRRV